MPTGQRLLAQDVAAPETHSAPVAEVGKTDAKWETSQYLVAWNFETFSSHGQILDGDSLASSISDLAHRNSGGLWRSLDRQDDLKTPGAINGMTADVVINVQIREMGGGLEATVQLSQPAYSRTRAIHISRQPTSEVLARSIVQAAFQLFSPEFRLQTKGSGNLSATLRGSELLETWPAVWSAPLRTLAQPWICYLDESGRVARRERVDWTVIELVPDQPPVIHSGTRSALGGRSRSQIDLRGLLIPPDPRSAEVTILTLGSLQPQAGIDVFVTSRPLPAATRVQLERVIEEDRSPEKAGEKSTNTSAAGPLILALATTNLRGAIDVRGEGPEATSRLVWLNAFGGDQLLARVPLILGADPSATLQLPEDRPRRDAEASLASLAEEITLIVAKRTSLLARLRNAARQKKWKQVESLRREIGELPVDQDVATLVSAIRSQSVEAATKIPSRSAAERIKRQCDAIVTLARQHLGKESLKILDEEISQLRQAEDSAAAPNN
ncbi:MAG: hypothetical protein C0478_02210 [Planctomyces sp.]|nr:hypothetical protein [Planctomyces sp.]